MVFAHIVKSSKAKHSSIVTSLVNKYLADNRITSESVKILEVGAGNCWLIHSLPLDGVKIGIDLHDHNHSKNNIYKDFISDNKSHFIYGDATNLPFNDESFDLVFSNEFVSHVRNINKTILEQLRILKPNGLIIIMDSDFFNPFSFFLCFFVNYFTSRKSSLKRGGIKWLLHREDPFFELAPIKDGMRNVCWCDENIHGKSWWIKHLKIYTKKANFNVSHFWSYFPISFKLIIVGRKI